MASVLVLNLVVKVQIREISQEMRGIWTGKEQVKLYLQITVSNPQKSTQKIGTNNGFGKATG